MKQQSKLLKVVSIIMIVFGALGTIGTILTTFMMSTVMQSPEMQELYSSLGVPEISMGYYVLSIIVAIAEVAAGIVGVMYRSKKSVLTAGIIWLALILIMLVWDIILVGFSFTVILSFIFPILYFWGWYQSN